MSKVSVSFHSSFVAKPAKPQGISYRDPRQARTVFHAKKEGRTPATAKLGSELLIFTLMALTISALGFAAILLHVGP